MEVKCGNIVHLIVSSPCHSNTEPHYNNVLEVFPHCHDNGKGAMLNQNFEGLAHCHGAGKRAVSLDIYAEHQNFISPKKCPIWNLLRGKEGGELSHVA